MGKKKFEGEMNRPPQYVDTWESRSKSLDSDNGRGVTDLGVESWSWGGVDGAESRRFRAALERRTACVGFLSFEF